MDRAHVNPEELATSPPPVSGDSATRVEAFVSLLGQNQRRIHLFVASLVPNASDADDILQETNLVLWREFDQFVLGTNFASWACTVAFNQVLAWRKRKQRDRLVFSDQFLSAVSGELLAQADRIEDRSSALASCIERLAPQHRELLRLRYTDGNPVETIATQFQRTTEAVYRMLSRIRHALHECVTASLAQRVSP